jgi:hypothetical protein
LRAKLRRGLVALLLYLCSLQADVGRACEPSSYGLHDACSSLRFSHALLIAHRLNARRFGCSRFALRLGENLPLLNTPARLRACSRLLLQEQLATAHATTARRCLLQALGLQLSGRASLLLQEPSFKGSALLLSQAEFAAPLPRLEFCELRLLGISEHHLLRRSRSADALGDARYSFCRACADEQSRPDRHDSPQR